MLPAQNRPSGSHFAVVHPDLGPVGGQGIPEPFRFSVTGLPESETLARRQDQAAIPVESESADGRPEVEMFYLGQCGVRSVEVLAGDIHPVEAFFVGVPERAFTQLAVDFKYGFSGYVSQGISPVF